jgi:hypothetical protein
VQCDDRARVCLIAPNSELDSDGNWSRPLDRAVHDCSVPSGVLDRATLAAGGYTLVPALADAPYGWMRDERQRVFQVIFDLHRRAWVGASWSPMANSGDPRGDDELGRFAFDVGLFELEQYNPSAHGGGTRHRLRLGTGEVRLAPFSVDAVLLHYDLSHRYEAPLLRLTTFVGRPRRFDLDLSLGFWMEAGALEIHHAATGDESLWRYGTFNATLDLWHTNDMTSFVRVRGGAGFEKTYAADGQDRAALTPNAALEADFTLDRAGFHHLKALASWESPQYVDAPASAGASSQRWRGELGFETIALAVNDQPITLRLGSAMSWRDDIPGITPQWVYTATAGLRLSLWAPAREKN